MRARSQRAHCRPGGISPLSPVLVLRLPLRESSEDRLPSRPPTTSPAGVAGCSGDFEPADRMIGRFFTPWKSFLYRSSGLLGGLGELCPVGGAVVDEAGDDGVMAKVAEWVRTGELGRGEGEKLKALEATDGVAGCEAEPYGQLGTWTGQVRERWWSPSFSDSSVSENWGEEDVKSGMRDGEREICVQSSEELRLRLTCIEGGEDVSPVEPVITMLSVTRWPVPVRRPRSFSAVDCLRILFSRKSIWESLKTTRSRAERTDLSMARSTAVRRSMRSSSGQVARSPFSIASTMNFGVGLLRTAKPNEVSGKIVISPV